MILIACLLLFGAFIGLLFWAFEYQRPYRIKRQYEPMNISEWLLK